MIMSMNRINEKEMLIMGLLEDLKALILENENNKGFVLLCPVCGSKLITRIAKLYDLEDNLMLHPKARCTKCPFQIT